MPRAGTSSSFVGRRVESVSALPMLQRCHIVHMTVPARCICLTFGTGVSGRCVDLTSLAKASVQMWQALVVTTDRDVLALLREHLEAPGYAVVEAGNASDAVILLETSGACVVILLEHLLGTPRSEIILAPALKDDPLVSSPPYLLLAANPTSLGATHEHLPAPPVLLVFEPKRLEDLLDLMAQVEQYLGRNPALVAVPLHPSRGNLLGESR
jgi:CheY-like chemotaxis protein